ncbi:aminotransferase class I/II-fold pyridoxal phosphate-dependent enzyme [Neofamilia massiliensis]|uniref:methionine gamma-lyase family protein n=1 Tax=Neofamilia massiliensis TaxID=1673724 RepID=UPI0006BB7859|nr:methionine gamma-lyase family protein [Neofamilia massiliensis]
MNLLKKYLKENYHIDEKIYDLVSDTEQTLVDKYLELDEIRTINQYKIMQAFNKNMLSAADFYWTTGYGYGDIGRDKVEDIYSDIFNTEDSLVRPAIASGTHAINLVLSGLLKHGDELIEISGTPYDTLMDVIGCGDEDNEGSLIANGIKYSEVDLVNNKIDVKSVLKKITPRTKVLAIQRSTGYSDRRALTIDDMEVAIKEIKNVYPNIIIFVDNCYGEFTDIKEPTDVGADIIAGSLIKNIGGGIAYSGGYITGKKRLVQLVSRRLTAPGLEKEVGLSFGTTRSTLQGLFLAPLVVNQAMKGATLMGKVFSDLGFRVVPHFDDKRSDIVQAIQLNKADLVEIFCKCIQEASAVDSHVTPVPSPMPGYNNDIIMAAGGFVDGSSIEMSADGPLREPYFVYYQGGLTIDQIKLGIYLTLNEFLNKGFINI